MANHNLPTLTSTYTNFVNELDGRLDDLAVGMDPAVVTVTNPPVNSIRWVGAQNRWERWNGTAWVVLSSLYNISISGNAATATTATTLQTARTIWGQSFNGSANISGALSSVTTLAMSGQLTNTVATGTAPFVIASTTRVANLNVATAGNADTATALQTARNINGVSFNGTADITLPTVNTTGDQTIGGTKTFSGRVNGKTSGTDATPAFFAATTGGAYATMWTRRGVPFHTTAATTGSSYAPALSHFYTHNAGWDGVYSVGVLNLDAANPGAFVIHHLNSAAGQDYAWLFHGSNGEFVSPGNIRTAGGQFIGNGAGLTSLPAAQLTGTVPTARLGSGTPNSTNFLRGDGQWSTIEGVPAGAINYFATRTPPTGYLAANGAAVSRTTFAALFAAICPVIGNPTVTIASPGVFTLNGHGLINGDPVRLSTTGALPTGLNTTTTYFVVGADANTFRLSATVGGAAINTSGTQSGTHTVQSFAFGAGDGSTTFTLPDLRGEFIRGLDSGRGVDTGRVLGSAQAGQMQSHTHAVPSVTGVPDIFFPTGVVLNNNHNASTPNTTLQTTGQGGTSNGSENRPRNVALLACIKF